MSLVLTSGKFLEALGSEIGTGSIFCLSFSLSNRVFMFIYVFLIFLGGECVPNIGTVLPKKECYCPLGRFGRTCEKVSSITSKVSLHGVKSYLIDVLYRQPIKLFQVVSTSELRRPFFRGSNSDETVSPTLLATYRVSHIHSDRFS